MQFVFVYVQMDNEDYGEAVSGFFGVTGTAPKVLVYTGNEDMRKFILDGELTVKNIKVSSTCETLWFYDVLFHYLVNYLKQRLIIAD